MSFLKHISKFGKKIAITDGQNNLSYEKLIQESKKFTNKIESKSLIFLISNNDIETICFYLSCILRKIPTAIINGNIKSKNLKKFISKYKPKYIIIKNDNYIKGYRIIDHKQKYFILKKKKKIKYKISKSLALLLTTSGTTGDPKFVRLSYENFLNNIRNIIKSIKIKKSDSVITTLPISYSYGLSIINTFLYSGSKIFINEKSVMDKNFWNLYKRFEPSHFYGVPFTFEILSKFNFKYLYSVNLKTIAVAGGKLDQALFKKLVKFTLSNKIKFYNMYGQTEASPRMGVLDDKYKTRKINSIGKAINGGKFILISKKNKKILTPYTEGLLIYFGKNVFMGYSNSYKDLHKENEKKNMLKTGDIAFFDQNNFFFITGREKRFIKLFGNRINLDDVEKMINHKGFENKCEIIDNLIKVNYNNNEFNIKEIRKLLSNELGINQNYIQFNYVKDLFKNAILRK